MNYKIRLLKLISMMLLLPLIAMADEGEDAALTKKDMLETHTVSTKDNRGDIFVVVFKNPHNGRTQIEIRPQCGQKEKDPLKLPAMESFSFCKMVKKSIKANDEKTELQFEFHEYDTDDYNQRLERGQPVREKCLKKREIKKFDLVRICEGISLVKPTNGTR